MKRLVVMLRGKLVDIDTIGAGILFGRASDRLYVATANHVVRQGIDRAQKIEVQVRWLPGEWHEAQLLDHVDLDLDLAVLAVRGVSQLAVPQIAWNVLIRSDALVAGQKVVPIGYPSGMAWFTPQQPHLVAPIAGTLIQTEGNLVPGNSGGALVTEDWGIVGIVRQVGSLLGSSSRIERVVEKLQEWGYPIEVTFRKGPSTSEIPSTACTVSGRVFDEEAQKPVPAINLGLCSGTGENCRTVERTVVMTDANGGFSFACPPKATRDQFPLTIQLWHPSRRGLVRTNVQVGYGEQRTNVNVPVKMSLFAPIEPRDPSRTSRPLDVKEDCQPIDYQRLTVEYHRGRGGWHVVSQQRGVGHLLLPDFEENEQAARAAAAALQHYRVTDYCQIARPPVVFYLLADRTPASGPFGAERCTGIDPAGLTPEEGMRSRGGGWILLNGVLRFQEQAQALEAVQLIRHYGFAYICFPGRPMMYLRR